MNFKESVRRYLGEAKEVKDFLKYFDTDKDLWNYEKNLEDRRALKVVDRFISNAKEDNNSINMIEKGIKDLVNSKGLLEKKFSNKSKEDIKHLKKELIQWSKNHDIALKHSKY